MFGWIALIGNLMQIFLSVTQIPRCYCNGWEDFMPPGFHQMAAKVIGRRAWELTFDTPRACTKVPAKHGRTALQ